MSKILEKVVSAQLCSFLQKNDIYEEFQSGFRARHSTETALVKITNDLLLVSDKGCISLLVLLDLSAAFDTIDHDILIDRLQNYTGIQGQALRWFRSSRFQGFFICHIINYTGYNQKWNVDQIRSAQWTVQNNTNYIKVTPHKSIYIGKKREIKSKMCNRIKKSAKQVRCAKQYMGLNK